MNPATFLTPIDAFFHCDGARDPKKGQLELPSMYVGVVGFRMSA